MSDKLEKLRARLKNKPTHTTKGDKVFEDLNIEKPESLQDKFTRMIDSIAPAVEPDREPARVVEWTCPACNTKYEMYAQDVPVYKCDSCLMRNR